MNSHLSKEEFARCFVGEASSAERQHISECEACRRDIVCFAGTIASFRRVIRERIEARATAQAGGLLPLPLTPQNHSPRWRSVLVTAAGVLLGVFPFLLSERKLPEVSESGFTQISPEALMNAVNLHLLRTVPAPMEPAMARTPNDDVSKATGGVQ